MRKKILIAIIVVLLLGAAVTAFALNNGSGGSDIEACPIDPDVVTTDC